MNSGRVNLVIFIFLIVLYIAGQFLIGAYHPDEKRFIYDAPADVDFLYYAAITNSLLDHFPPQNPAMAGIKLTQPFIQYYPAAVLTKFVNAFNSMRLLNVVYLILFGLLLMKYFPGRYGIPLVMIFAASSIAVDINALGIDLIARGFTHTPFLILLTVALFGKNTILRLAALFTAAFVNGYMMLMILPFLLVNVLFEKNKISIYLLLDALVALAFASLFVSSEVTARPFYFIFIESFVFDPVEILKHAAPFLILSYFIRNRTMLILLLTAVVFGSLAHYNPFFPIFLVYYAGAMMIASGKYEFPKTEYLAVGFAAVLVLGFITSAVEKYGPESRHYYPRYDTRIEKAVDWLENNTEQNAVVAALTADADDLGLVMQYRPVYLGYIGHLSHLGLDWKGRYDNMVRLYSGGQPITGVDYVFYGPVERKYYPMVNLPFETVYRDEFVIIYRMPEL